MTLLNSEFEWAVFILLLYFFFIKSFLFSAFLGIIYDAFQYVNFRNSEIERVMKFNPTFQRRTMKDWLIHPLCEKLGKRSKDRWRN
mmetsp:Transcript_16865/g.2765  ORF Transcript_16865/g.2765 Transcript_16865/m.2765 type:complete len:86 (+) Transcript_16865:2231-2488(+)